MGSNLLLCPICKAGLIIQDDRCQCNNGHSFPIEDGIANIMLKNTQIADHYSFQWGKGLNFYGAIEEKGKSFLKTTASCKLGWDDYLPRTLEKAKNVIDVACGYGGIADIVKSAGFKGEYLGLDINATLNDIKKKRFADHPNFRFIRADMNDDIFTESFDVAVCRSAIMYAPNPEQTFGKIAGSVKKGGQFIISAYTKKSPMRELSDDYFREYFSKMSEQEAFEALKEFSLLGKLLSELDTKVHIPVDLQVMQIKKGTYDVQRLIYYHFIKCFWNKDWGMKNSTIVNFDWYHPEYSWRFKRKEIEKWFHENGFEIVKYSKVPAQHFFAGKKL